MVRLFTDKTVVTLSITFSGRVFKKKKELQCLPSRIVIDHSFQNLMADSYPFPSTRLVEVERTLSPGTWVDPYAEEVKSWTMELIVKHLKSSLFALYRG